jgi:short-subunit dehydrogenase
VQSAILTDLHFFALHPTLRVRYFSAGAVYATTKAFVFSLAHSLRYELGDTGISVTALQPGPTDTDFFHRAGMNNTQFGSEG